MSSIAIGIDLGTTYTLAAIYNDGLAEIIPNLEGDRLTPSMIFYDPDNLKPSVGKVADNQSLKCPKNFLFDIKRIIGRNYNDAHVQSFVEKEKDKQFPFKIIKGDHEEPLINLETNEKSLITKTPEEISSEVLGYIKKSVKEHIGVDVCEAVISVPAYFSYAQKAATKRAAEIVGYKVLKLITEPVAAAIHYTFGKIKEETNILMFDLGGGTLDVSVIQVSKDNFAVKAIEGDMFLGGRDFDEVLFNYLRLEVGRRYGNQFIKSDTKKGQRFLHRLRKYANRYKHMLTSLEEYCMAIDIDSETECELSVTRNMLEILSAKLFTRIIDKVKQCLLTAKLSADDIHKVVLVGGASRMPKLRKHLSSMFDQIELSTDLNPDEAVALGASIHAALLKGQIENRDKYGLTEVAPYSIGVRSKYDLMVPFIDKGIILPVSTIQIMNTTENDQRSVLFEIYEGERMNCKENKKLGSFSINKLPRAQSGDVQFEVSFYLDEDGLLSINATEKSTGSIKELQIEMHNLTLCDSAKLISFDEEQLLREEDELYDKFYRLKLQADTFCKGILYNLADSNMGTKSYNMEQECRQFLEKSSEIDFRDIEKLKSEYDELQKRLNSWLNQYGSIGKTNMY